MNEENQEVYTANQKSLVFAYLDLTDTSKRENALNLLRDKGILGKFEARSVKESLEDLAEVYDGVELSERMNQIFKRVRQTVSYGINDEEVSLEEGVYKGEKIFKEAAKDYKR